MDQSPRPSALQIRAGHLSGFAQDFNGITLRPYQIEAAQAVIDSIREHAGRAIVIMISRQAGKDELSANLKSYLLVRLHAQDAGIVEVNPTYKPQTINAMQRLEDHLWRNPLTRGHWRKRSDFMRLVGRAKVSFLSGDSKASVVGAVASVLLIVNEAQDIEPGIYDKRFAPMAASTNATRLFMGTAWTSQTLLARELRAARQAEQADGLRRVFVYDADDVRAVLPAYGKYVDGEIARLGRGHPLIKTQYFNEEIDAQAGMFNAARRALMQGDETACGVPTPSPALPQMDDPAAAPSGTIDVHLGEVARGRRGYVFAIDVAGQDESSFGNSDDWSEGRSLHNPGRDSVSLTIASVDLSALDTLQAPIFRIVQRDQWTGLNHIAIFGKLMALADRWRPQHIVIDATGVGEGLWALLDKHYPTRVVPVKFSAQKKSEIGYRLIAMIETGRFRDCCAREASSLYRPIPSHEGRDTPAFATNVTREMIDRQYAACISEVLMGPQKTLRWGVPEGTRDENGALIHDDIVMADALLAEADKLDWSLHSPTLIVHAKDPLEEMSHF